MQYVRQVVGDPQNLCLGLVLGGLIVVVAGLVTLIL